MVVDLRNVYKPEPMRDGGLPLRLRRPMNGKRARSRRRCRTRAKAARGSTRVILAGGAGERFWPASRARAPEAAPARRRRTQRSSTRRSRARGAARGPGASGSSAAASTRAAMRRAAGFRRARVLVEPAAPQHRAWRSAWAAQRIARRDPDAVLAVLPADHHIPDARGLRARPPPRRARGARRGRARHAGRRARRAPRRATATSTSGRRAGRAIRGFTACAASSRSPTRARARRFLRGGGYLWNAGIFVWTARAILEEIEALRAGAASRRWRRSRAAKRGARARARARLSERARRSRSTSRCSSGAGASGTLPVRFRWSDVGTWASLADELGVAAGRSRVVAGELVFDEPGGNLVWGGTAPIALLGVEGLAVVDTGDALLVARLERSHEVRRIVHGAKGRGASGRGQRYGARGARMGTWSAMSAAAKPLEALRSIPLFAAVSDGDLEEIASLADRAALPRNKTIVEEGLPGDYMYVIREGR